jgi:hypothetical protein
LVGRLEGKNSKPPGGDEARENKMNLMHSICCLFPGRCRSDAIAPVKQGQDPAETREARQQDASAQPAPPQTLSEQKEPASPTEPSGY